MRADGGQKARAGKGLSNYRRVAPHRGVGEGVVSSSLCVVQLFFSKLQCSFCVASRGILCGGVQPHPVFEAPSPESIGGFPPLLTGTHVGILAGRPSTMRMAQLIVPPGPFS